MKDLLKVAVIGGDGTGPEVTAEGVKVLKEVAKLENINLELTPFDLGGERYLKTGVIITDDEIEQLRLNAEMPEHLRIAGSGRLFADHDVHVADADHCGFSDAAEEPFPCRAFLPEFSVRQRPHAAFRPKRSLRARRDLAADLKKRGVADADFKRFFHGFRVLDE